MAYYRKTGLFSIMHTLVVRDDVLAENPWVARSLFKGFEKAKAEAWRSMLDPRKVSLVWMQDLLEEQQALLGRDPWPYGLEPNRKALEAMQRYGQLCGLVTRPLRDESDWFVPSTLDETPDLLH
jgi:4,5-dihydroxyphthalate decarboxylase